MVRRITVLPDCREISAGHGANLLEVLRANGFITDAPCGGKGTCGKCTVTVNGEQVLACQTVVLEDITVTLPHKSDVNILTGGISAKTDIDPGMDGYLLAFDIGTTTLAGFLLDVRSGKELASGSLLNPQTAYGADVISRIQYALKGGLAELTEAIRNALYSMTVSLCSKASIPPAEIGVVSIVGNPAMRQLFLGISPENLAKIPFAPVLTESKTLPAGDYLPLWDGADLVIIPDISGFVGTDTVACVLASGLETQKVPTLLVDIGTNGEMVLWSGSRMAACSTAAGPALEGANIRFGIRGAPGAIDHVTAREGKIRCSVIGGGEALGICGSGLIDAVAVGLDLGLLNSRGRVLTEDRCIHLTDKIYLTQEDIRQVQLAKGAIAAGIRLMAAHLGIRVQDVQKVYLAGAFGSFMDPKSACRIGLLPRELEGKITPIGNAAGSGAKLLACSRLQRSRAARIAEQTEFLELASLPGFQRCFADNMRFTL